MVPLPIPADRMDCVAVEGRPAIPAEHMIDWTKVTTVPQARAEHDTYVRSVRNREGVITGYVVEIEGKLWACASDDEWLRDWQKPLPDPG